MDPKTIEANLLNVWTVLEKVHSRDNTIEVVRARIEVLAALTHVWRLKECPGEKK